MNIITSSLMVALATTAFTSAAFGATKEMTLEKFSKIKVYSSVDLDVSVGKKPSFSIDGDEDDLANLIIKVEDDTLIIKTKKHSIHMDKVKATLSTMDLSAFYVHGSSDAVIRDVKSKSFNLGISGSGDVVLNGKSDELTVKVSGSGDVMSKSFDVTSVAIGVSGSGDIDLAGKCQSLDVAISGSGDFKGRNLTCATAKIRISGSGDAEVYASDAIEVRTSGSSDINIYGNPKTLKNSSSGSSDLNMHKDK